MESNPTPKDFKHRHENVANFLLEALEEEGLKPRTIPAGRMDFLRGGLYCFELSEGTVDVAVLLSKAGIGDPKFSSAKAFFKVDYAIRGNIKGILPRRIVSQTNLILKGILRKRLETLNWKFESPNQGIDTQRTHMRDNGVPPRRGEVWEGGPYQKLTNRLNQDNVLSESLEGFIERERGKFLQLSIISDGWGESIRVRGSLWLRLERFLRTYADPSYFRIMNRIGEHIKEVRREFGGLTF